ncbi:type IV conjugative transfer system protein TraE [Desulfurobacterium sp. TC5-1]|uniref:type IV conjugative transfer system protein TraE n=1 Tax=Desulfurobacterium sp. TC5-1 TaxID=1158318 RepID=UPI0003B5360B|nr:type IV conjugative transfer system protein TraE [Desulfurobacterium sp. TC5-1]
MNWQKFRNSWDNLISYSQALAVAVIALAATNVFFAVVLIGKVKNQKVIILPPNVNKEFWVSGDKLSSSYVEMMGNFIADKYLSVSPETAAYQHSLLFPFVAPSALPDFKKAMQQYEAFIAREGISQVFYPRSVSFGKNQILVSGILKKYVEGTQIKSEKATVLIKYTVRNGQFQLLSLEVKDNA